MQLPVFQTPDPDQGGGSATDERIERRDRGPDTAGDQPPVLILRYGAMNWVGEFKVRTNQIDDWVGQFVVQSDRGIELAEPVGSCHGGPPCARKLAQVREYARNSGPDFCRPNAGRVLRKATSQDVNEHQRLNADAQKDIDQCALLAMQAQLDMKIVTAEHLLGGERIVFYFRADGRVDFRELVRELARRYRTRIEMRQVGARDEARLVADWEVCGRECCCKNFLKKLRPVNMKMAKLQKSTLDPSKVSGRCGRLRCCLRYEHEGYLELQAKLPRRNSRVRTEFGDGTVEDTQVLTQLVLVRLDNQSQYAIPVDEILEFNLPKPPPPPEKPADRNQPREDESKSRPRRSRRRGRPAAEDGQAPPDPDSSGPNRAAEDGAAPRSDGDDASAGRSKRRGRRRRRRPRPGEDSGGATS